MNFRRSLKLNRLTRHVFPLIERRPRPGRAEDRGQVLPFPARGSEPALPRFLERYSKQTTWARRVLPGFVTGAADVDPALVLTASAVGVAFGYQLLWLVLLCVPFLLTVFSVSGRIGYETRCGLIDLLRTHYGRNIARLCAGFVVAINMAMLIADLLAVTDALGIILDQRRIFFVAVVAYGVWNLLMFGNYEKITRSLAFLALPLLVYVVAAVFTRPSWGAIVNHTVLPRMYADTDYMLAVMAIFGALLTPYVLVWQTSSRRDSAVSGGSLHESEHRMGTLVTTVLCFCVMLVAGTVLHRPGALDSALTVKRAASALTPVLGEWGLILFSIGIIGAGMIALPVLAASLCYSVSEAMGWDYGLNRNHWEAKGFYVLISVAVFIAAAVNFLRLDTVDVIYVSQIAAGIMAVPILVFILLLSNDRRVMKTVNSKAQNFWLGAATGGIAASLLLLVFAALRR